LPPSIRILIYPVMSTVKSVKVQIGNNTSVQIDIHKDLWKYMLHSSQNWKSIVRLK